MGNKWGCPDRRIDPASALRWLFRPPNLHITARVWSGAIFVYGPARAAARPGSSEKPSPGCIPARWLKHGQTFNPGVWGPAFF